MRWRAKGATGRRKKILIVGAGDVAEMILREALYNHSRNYEIVGLIDDDPRKYKRRIHGVAVLGGTSDIPAIVDKKNVEEIIIAAPALDPDEVHDIVNYCIKSGAKYKTVPSISDVMDGTVSLKDLREVKYEDLLKRDVKRYCSYDRHRKNQIRD